MDISNINGISTGDIKSFFNNTSLTKTDKTDSFSDVLSAAMGSIGETNDLQNAAEQEDYNHYISSAFAYFADCRTYSQYISDSYVNSGADTYICAKNNCNFSCDDALWLMDARHYVRIYD